MPPNPSFRFLIQCSLYWHYCMVLVSTYEAPKILGTWRSHGSHVTPTARRKFLNSLAAVTSTLQIPPAHLPCFALSPEDAATAYDSYAATYNYLDGGQVATALGIETARARLISQAKGDVLEIGVGTGLNLNKYPREGLSSLTCVDISRGMLKEASIRLAACEAKNLQTIPVKFVQADATSDLVKIFGPASFDTVIDTFSLCVFGNDGAKQSLALIRDVVRQNGRVLLLENSRSTNPMLGLYQDATANSAAAVGGKGCVYNQDVGNLINESGMIIVTEETYAAGLFRSYVCRRTS